MWKVNLNVMRLVIIVLITTRINLISGLGDAIYDRSEINSFSKERVGQGLKLSSYDDSLDRKMNRFKFISDEVTGFGGEKKIADDSRNAERKEREELFEDEEKGYEPSVHNINLDINANTDQDSIDLAKKRFVVYWGQNSYGASHPNNMELWEKPLREYCEDDSIDIFVISFLHIFNADSDKPPEINLSYHCNTTFTDHPTLLSCPKIGQDILYCQSRGKKLLMSLGGAAGSYGFKTIQDASKFARTVWNMFLGGKSDLRPFGEAKLDGVDLDIEGGSSLGYPEFVHTLREIYVQSTNKRYYIGGAPQCVYPDAFLGDALNQAWFDFVFVQFYNNFCGVQSFSNPYGFNYHQWNDWAKTLSINPKVRVLLGVPGSLSAASNGYLEPTGLMPILKNITSYPSFGGVMAWDASQAGNNQLPDAQSFTLKISKWLRSPTSLLKYKINSAPSKPTILDRLDHILDGTACMSNSLGCMGSDYAFCVEGVWIKGQCPEAFKCTPQALKIGHLCVPTSFEGNKTLSNQPTSFSVQPGYNLSKTHSFQLMPKSKLSNTELMATITIRSLTSNPIAPNWQIQFNLSPYSLSLKSSTIGRLINNRSNPIIISDSDYPSMALSFDVVFQSNTKSFVSKISNSTQSNIPKPLRLLPSITDISLVNSLN